VNTIDDLSNLKSLCFNPSDGEHYHKHFKSFLIRASIEHVWSTYKNISPDETRNGSMVSFGMMYARKQRKITYPGDPYDGLEAGQIIFLNLNLLGSIVTLAVGHEITEVNDHERSFKICYLQNGASTGTQFIQLKKISETETEVTHETWYRSGSWFRDKILYPGFHGKGLTEFHGNVKQRAEV
jgi:hypothetical protein